MEKNKPGISDPGFSYDIGLVRPPINANSLKILYIRFPPDKKAENF